MDDIKNLQKLQQIEDFYISQGLKGESLRNALEKDQDYQRLLGIKKAEIKERYGISPEDEKKYVLPTEKDYQILATIRELKQKDITDGDRTTLDLIETQLLDDWRTPLEKSLEEIKRKYKI